MEKKLLYIVIALFTVLTSIMVLPKASAQTLDVAILEVKPDTDRTFVGKIVSINVTVKNNGTITSKFTVTAYFGNSEGNYTIGTLETPELSPGENTTLTFKWNTANVKPCQSYTIKANCTLEGDPTPEDNELVDGEVKINIFADLNDDGKVDLKDAAECIKAFGLNSSSPKWDPHKDLNDDKKIDIRDIALIIKNFGKSCS